MSEAYAEFLARKAQLGSMSGFEPLFMPSFLFDFQASLTDWNLRKGRSATFADCGLGKTPMSLVWGENVVRKTNKPVLYLNPLAVSYQALTEAAKFDIEAHRPVDGAVKPGINVANYQRLHYFNPDDFGGVICGESSILKSFDGATKKAVTEFMRRVQYRLLETATAAPNDYIELGTSSEALGELGYTDMLTRFFKNDQGTVKPMRYTGFGAPRGGPPGGEHTDKWRFKGHAEQDFWRWVASWARAMRRPSDLGFCDAKFVLPALIERNHMLDRETEEAAWERGDLFALPAVGLKEEREERRGTIAERCDKVVELVAARYNEPSLVWCGLNDEGDRIERDIPHAVQVAGKDSEEWKESAAQWFAGVKCLCCDPLFRVKLPAWRAENLNRKKSAPTSGIIIGPTSIDTGEPLSSAPGTMPRGGPSITTTPSTESGSRPKRSQTARKTRKRGGPEPSSNLALPSPGTTNFSPVRAVGAPSADRPTPETLGHPASTSITATRQAELEEFSARLAISALVSSGMKHLDLNAPQCICGHTSGKRVLISKPSMFGYGLNLQACAHMTFFPTHSYEQYYQAIRRCWRFGQTRPVTVDIIMSEGEERVMANLHRKATAADRMFTELVRHMSDAIRIERGVNYPNQERLPAWL